MALKQNQRAVQPPMVMVEGASKTSLHRLLFHVNPFWMQLAYFLSLSSLGFLLLRSMPMRHPTQLTPSNLDLFFMSVSATSVSSMSTVELESFSNSQCLVLTLLMFLGGEVVTSMLGLHLLNYCSITNSSSSSSKCKLSSPMANCSSQEVELGTINPSSVTRSDDHMVVVMTVDEEEAITKYKSMTRCLVLVVMAYLVLLHTAGCTVILAYLSLVPASKAVLERKGIGAPTFAVFTTVSSFANCGFVPTNENMVVFRTCSGLLLPVTALILAGNTMFPPLLRSVIWALSRSSRATNGSHEFDCLLKMSGGMKQCLPYNYDHLLSAARSLYLAITVLGLVALQLVAFCCMEWGSDGLDGMSTYQKLVAALFMSVNSRHAGESIMDLSAISSAILLLYVVMMYLPPYATFFPVEESGEVAREEQGVQKKKKRKGFIDKFILSQLSYVAIFVIVICITERKHLAEDPLNFNVLTVLVEVVSAYGNVGFSTGYSCKRQLKPAADGSCKDSWCGFSGRWSAKGKLTLILVMLFGRLKKFSTTGGKAWKLS